MKALIISILTALFQVLFHRTPEERREAKHETRLQKWEKDHAALEQVETEAKNRWAAKWSPGVYSRLSVEDRSIVDCSTLSELRAQREAAATAVGNHRAKRPGGTAD